MSEYTQCVVDRETDRLEDAERLGQQVLAWLVEREIVEERLSDCCLVDPGYRPGRHFSRACGHSDDNSPDPDHDGLLTLRTNGVQLYMRRHPFMIGQGAFGPARCPHCESEQEIDAYYEACDEWFNGGPGNMRCEACGVVSPVQRWEHDDLLCGTLGLVFWNWPSLSPEFLDALSERLGHRLSLIEGKL